MKATSEKRDLQRDVDSLLDFKTDLVKGIDHLYFMLKKSVQKVLSIEDKESFKIAEKDMKRLIVDWIAIIQSFFEFEHSSESDCSGKDESDSLELEISELNYFKKRLGMLLLELRKSLQIVKKNIGAMFKKTEKNFNSFFKEEKLALLDSKMADVKASLSHCRKTFLLIEETLLESNLYQELSLANPCSTLNDSSSSYNDVLKMELGARPIIDARTANLPTAMCSSQQHSLQKTATQKPISGSEDFTRNVPSYHIWKVTVHEVKSPSEIYLKICNNIPENFVRDLQDHNTEKIIQMARSQELLKCSLYGISPASNGAEWREDDKAKFKYLFMDSSSVFDVRFLVELQDSKDVPVPILMAIKDDDVLLQKYLQDLTLAVCCEGLINEGDHMNPKVSFNGKANERDIFSAENEILARSIESEYYSSENTKFLDDEDLDAVMNGYIRDMSDFCKFGLHCTHRICAKKHVDLTDRILDEDRSAKYEMYNQSVFPKRDSIVSMIITKIRSRNDLVGVILVQEQDSESEIDPENLTSLMEAMQMFYKGTKFIDFKGRPCEGELFAAKSGEDDSWYRSRVIDICGDEVEVYDVDTGYREIIPITNLRNLKNQFAHLPEQAVDIGLSNIQMLDTWSNKEAEWYEETMMENEFWGRIDEIIGQKMMLTLWHKADIKDGEFNDRDSINQILIDAMLAKEKHF